MKSFVMVAAVTVAGWFVKKAFGPNNINMFYLMIVVISAVKWGRGPAIMTALLSVFSINYFFVHPYLTSFGFDIQSAFVLVEFLLVGFIISELASQKRQQAIDAGQREKQVTMLYGLSKDLASADSWEQVIGVLRTNIGKIFDCHVAIFLSEKNLLEVASQDDDYPLTDRERSIAQWVFENGQPAGLCTKVFNDSKAQYLPFETSQGVFGVLGICFKKEHLTICDPKENHLLSLLANQASIAIQRTKLAEVSRQVELMHQTEKLQTALLNSISHDLRTPLVSIMGVLDTLLHDFSSIDQQTRRELLETAYEDSDHLNRLVANLLDMTRLEAKALKIRIEPCDLRDVIGASLQPLKDEMRDHDVLIQVPEGLPEVPMDFTLMMRVFINLVDNAVKYSKPNTRIEIAAEELDGKVRIDIKDEGIGIPPEDLGKVFDKFYRAVHRKKVTGTGLGLSICKGIVEAHDGEIYAKNNSGQGTTVSMILPLVRQEVAHG